MMDSPPWSLFGGEDQGRAKFSRMKKSTHPTTGPTQCRFQIRGACGDRETYSEVAASIRI